VETLRPEEAAALIQASAISEHLVTGLDVWAARLLEIPTGDMARKGGHLLDVARRVDPDPWRNRLRDAVRSGDRAGLEQLARTAPVEELSAATLGVFGLRVAAIRNAPWPSEAMVDLLRHAQARFPADFWINFSLAQALGQVRPARGDESLGFMRVAVALRPQNATARVDLGIGLRGHGDLNGALAEFQKAVSLSENYPMAHNWLGLALRDKGAVDQAAAEFRKAITINDDSLAHTNLGNILHDAGDLGGAVAEHRAAIRRDGQNVAAHNNLGRALFGQGHLDEAIAAFRAAIRVSGEFAQAYTNLGVALMMKGDEEGAIAAHREAVRLQPEIIEGLLNFGVMLKDRGQFAEALTSFRRAHELASKDPRRSYPTARLIKECERFLELEPKLPAILAGREAPADVAERLDYARLCEKNTFTHPQCACIGRRLPRSRTSATTPPAPPLTPAALRGKTRLGSAMPNARDFASRRWTGCGPTLTAGAGGWTGTRTRPAPRSWG
jgi:tetratricopeptide (TPR) repeat protein